MIKFTPAEWKPIRRKLKEEYSWKPSVFMIREVMKRELGFTIRYHEEWKGATGYTEIVYLDFYDEAAETMFRLKYL